jgi:hypothetical protein
MVLKDFKFEIQYMCSSISKDKFIIELKSSVNMLNF